MLTDLGQAPAEHIDAEVKQCEARESEENPEQKGSALCFHSSDNVVASGGFFAGPFFWAARAWPAPKSKHAIKMIGIEPHR